MAVKTTRSKVGSIYFIYDAKVEAIKIGFSTNVSDRFSTLQTASATKLELLGTMLGSMADEQRLHAKFQRMHGEWFHITNDLLSFIQQRATLVAALPEVRPMRRIAEPLPVNAEDPVKTDLTFPATIYRGVCIQIVGMLFVWAHHVVLDVFLPAFRSAAPEFEISDLSATIFMVAISAWALTYRHRFDREPKKQTTQSRQIHASRSRA